VFSLSHSERRAIRILRWAATIIILATHGRATHAQAPRDVHVAIDRLASEVNQRVITWRRDIHQHPELSGQEARTARVVAEHLRAMGLDVRENVGGHGVVALLRGGRPGPVVALRAELDALPVTEQTSLPFKSTTRTTYRGQDVGVMHACGHDAHMAMLLGAASVLTSIKDQLPGSVKFIFQPAEESPPAGGAGPMIAAGVLENPAVNAVFGLHVFPGELGRLEYRPGPLMASADNWRVVVHGRQTHGARPWDGVDPVVIGSQIVLAFQTIVSRQADITQAPAVVTVGAFNGGVRENIIPDSAVLIGTVRTFDAQMRADIHARMKRTAESVAASAGGRAVVSVELGYPVTVNDSAMVRRMTPTLARVAGPNKSGIAKLSMPAEDFSRFLERVPGMIVFMGASSPGTNPATAPANHSPLFDVDERALPVGVRALAGLAVDYLTGTAPR
jgi:amidohydrolase